MRLHKYKIYAALAFARANDINKITMDSAKPHLGSSLQANPTSTLYKRWTIWVSTPWKQIG